MSLIKVENVVKKFGNQFALDHLTLNFEEKEQYAVMGASGSGKSTLLYLIGGLDRPDSGAVIVDGKNLININDEELAKFRNNYVGFVFQFHFLLPSMNCFKNMLLPAEIGRVKTKELVNRVKDFADFLGVSSCLQKFPYQLSGGEQQRVNIVRALSLSPKLLLCDEPTGNLDSENSHKVIELIKRLARENGSTLIVVTHDQEISKSFSHQFVMQDGKLIQSVNHEIDAMPRLPN